MFVPTQPQFQALTDRKINWGITLCTGNTPHDGQMCCQFIHGPTKAVLATGYGREDLDAFEDAYKQLPAANVIPSGDPAENAALHAKIAELEATIAAGKESAKTAPKSGRGGRKTDPVPEVISA